MTPALMLLTRSPDMIQRIAGTKDSLPADPAVLTGRPAASAIGGIRTLGRMVRSKENRGRGTANELAEMPRGCWRLFGLSRVASNRLRPMPPTAVAIEGIVVQRDCYCASCSSTIRTAR